MNIGEVNKRGSRDVMGGMDDWKKWKPSPRINNGTVACMGPYPWGMHADGKYAASQRGAHQPHPLSREHEYYTLHRYESESPTSRPWSRNRRKQKREWGVDELDASFVVNLNKSGKGTHIVRAGIPQDATLRSTGGIVSREMIQIVDSGWQRFGGRMMRIAEERSGETLPRSNSFVNVWGWVGGPRGCRAGGGVMAGRGTPRACVAQARRGSMPSVTAWRDGADVDGDSDVRFAWKEWTARVPCEGACISRLRRGWHAEDVASRS
ncbi:hypothetical protein C8J57DRAFT_1235191, partial [Mycena rebaudengoi]